MRRRDHERIVGDMRREIAYLREQNRDLLDRLMYLSGSTWTPPPPQSSGFSEEEPAEPYSFAPEQEFDATHSAVD